MRHLLRGVFVGLLATCGFVHTEISRANGLRTAANLRLLAHQVIYGEAAERRDAMIRLREVGPQGLRALEQEVGDQPVSAAWRARRDAAFDAVGAQRDNTHSALFWYTNFEKAVAAAKAEGKPILSLRLLGRLDEEYSCANSRFFRTALYANAEVAEVLRERFVLHWQSVRPVPKVTIDFGDGRQIRRTLTGNSIHYILDAQGRPVEALPGLYAPQAFLRGLERAEKLALESGGLDSRQKDAWLRQYHAAQLQTLLVNWRSDLSRLTTPVGLSELANPVQNHPIAISPIATGPIAMLANRRALTKAAVETPLLLGVLPNAKRMEAQTDDATWARIAQLHAEDARLDAQSRDLMRSKVPNAEAAARVAVTKSLAESPLLRAIHSFERSMAQDTVRNEYLLHRRIHEWFMSGEAGPSVDALNEKVYAELFLTPSSDPWLGLAPADGYTALDGQGLVTSPQERSR
ncbi:MAG: hypothetical protein L0387_19825 [Acidobacteria bacterium]|nr:hypothetical protein [Acidobacteriota bacterium]MCI0720881.1 hypothetical protein [Acidobacteriota bacterium]